MQNSLFERVYLAILTGYVQRNGILFADENAFNNVANNVGGLANAVTEALMRRTLSDTILGQSSLPYSKES